MKLLILILAGVAAAAEDSSKWSWGDDDDGKGRTGDNRYIRPDYRPIRPGGDGFDYNSGPVVPGANLDPILYGPAVPAWIRDDPRFQEFDSCKCSRGFNCPGLKFGSCSRGKQYCCFSGRKYHGGRPGYPNSGGNYHNRPYQNGLPFRPFNSIPPEYYGNGNYYNGNYNGDYSGYDRPYNNYNRPYHGNHGNYGNYGNDGDYDGPYQGPYAPDYSGNYNPYNQGGGFNWQNPYRRRPYDGDFYGRSGSKTKNGNTKTANDVSQSKPATDGKDE
ncbi:uncharacterized protein LOC105692369 isoform X2 [Athalia rosae]|uniref:uncharacterized protein LOC105692369 isoform X2 n=1 Tax=Athalia rosae TaxID=37344 RepID=UPI000626A85C|nr:uncharacterized protein LOC105692369 isoform X2 [Athalia rosae]XP_048507424.1 uncharacterized protein LOC105692369 isoform X2 [Athalia rosae]